MQEGPNVGASHLFPVTDPPTVIFDLDGTLADTSGDLISAANSTLSDGGYGRPLDMERDRLTAFLGGKALLRAGLAHINGAKPDEEFVGRTYPKFLRIYEEEIDRHTKLYSGVGDVLGSMRGSGWRLGVCTNKPERLARILLSRLGVLGCFDSLVGADTLKVRKPDPEPLLHSIAAAGGEPGRSVFVGDTEMDLKTARAASVPIILVSFGPEDSGVARFGPDAMLDTFDHLPEVAAGLVPPGA